MSFSEDLYLRVSVATYNRLLFPHPQTGVSMLALERKATLLTGDAHEVRVWAQPLGGAVRILDSRPLQELIGEIRYDSERSRAEQDFRILIPPSRWETVKNYCLRHLGNPRDAGLESLPDRELTEEFAETLHVDLRSEQYTVQPLGFVVENIPAPTANANAQGMPTVRLYRIFDVWVADDDLRQTMLAASEQCSDRELASRALRNGRGRANSILTLPLETVTKAYLSLAPEARFRKLLVENHELDESVLAVLQDIDIPQYQRL